MTIKELKKELGITNSDIAGFFGLSGISYENSTAKKRYESALCSFYVFVKKQNAEGDKKNKTITESD